MAKRTVMPPLISLKVLQLLRRKDLPNTKEEVEIKYIFFNK